MDKGGRGVPQPHTGHYYILELRLLHIITDLCTSDFLLPRPNAAAPDRPQSLVVKLDVDTIRSDVK